MFQDFYTDVVGLVRAFDLFLIFPLVVGEYLSLL